MPFKKLATITGCILAYLVVTDVLGVAACFVFDVIPNRYSSPAACYAVWFVLAVFCGMLSYTSAGAMASPTFDQDWTNRQGAGKTGRLIIWITAGILVAISLISYFILWPSDSESVFFVPDSEPLTIFFFVILLASSVFAHKTFQPMPKVASKEPNSPNSPGATDT